MDMTCRCKGSYTCVACKVRRGDYRDWMLVEAERPKCGAVDCDRTASVVGLCWMHYEKRRVLNRRIA